MPGSEPVKKARLEKLNEADERRLIEAAQQDRVRFAELYENYFELVYGYVGRRVRHRAATEDLTSDVFQRALASLPRYKWTGAPFAAWLFRIASNLIADRARREAKLLATARADELVAASPDKDSQETLEAVERQVQIFQLVEELPEDQRRVVALRFAEEKSIKEIATELGRSQGAVKQLQFRALENLRKKFTTADTEKKRMKMR
jgi:RNA polymerase sigma-70 factor (ECF subfamily)